MNIDERLEKLTERHEALTQSAELITHDIRTLGILVKEIAGGIRDLVAVARSHEQRISRLENPL
jgi:prefoldin subunit 5